MMMTHHHDTAFINQIVINLFIVVGTKGKHYLGILHYILSFFFLQNIFFYENRPILNVLILFIPSHSM